MSFSQFPDGFLDADISERVRLVSDRPASGRFVVLWLHNALRVDDNPAFVVASAAANSLRLPLLIYQGVSERYPFASDRHHTFILEGARDLARQLRCHGLTLALHVARPGHRGDILRQLARDAALVVTDDVPTEPSAGRLDRLARTVETPVWAVDSACLVPMTSTRRAYERAFKFRRATEDQRQKNLGRRWDAPQVSAVHDLSGLPFEPIPIADHSDADIARLVGRCEIDHSVGPVPHTRGGSSAGRARWEAFRGRGLTRYARDRNDALRPGVSRMSAYLHYGMVSAFELARDAVDAGEGGEKYLDELFVWRELAWHFCHHRTDHGSLNAIPEWARNTLHEHTRDSRSTLYDWETLARGETANAFWNAAQHSLLIHGELHNNVRMTWGKAVLNWTSNPESALETLIDLNHRYALDGRDPSSYGGILWCLGQFDRPFEPAKPVFGTVRPRNTADHTKRLPVAEFASHARRPLFAKPLRVAVVGAGLAGLIAARTLADHGLDVTVLDKGRRAGGRTCHRETNVGPFDHGAPGFQLTHPQLSHLKKPWIDAGVLAEWTPGRVTVTADGAVSQIPAQTVLVGRAAASDLASHLSQSLPRPVRQSAHVREMTLSDQITLTGEANNPLQFNRVVLAVPPANAASLLESAGLAQPLTHPPMRACWTLLIALPALVGAPGDWIEFQNHPTFRTAIRDSAKPNRPAGERWVVHTTGEWAAANLERERDDVAEELASKFLAWLDAADTTPHLTQAHRWRYACPDSEAVASPPSFSEDRIILCGDWTAGPNADAALTSGITAAGQLLRSLHAAS